MRPAEQNILQETRDAILVMHELGNALRRSLGPTENESLPPSMALLLMQLALAEVVRTASEEECDSHLP
jgi:hypothetical protein